MILKSNSYSNVECWTESFSSSGNWVNTHTCSFSFPRCFIRIGCFRGKWIRSFNWSSDA